jgi:DNA-directed RNA polymerase specialized sigma24 family protein
MPQFLHCRRGKWRGNILLHGCLFKRGASPVQGPLAYTRRRCRWTCGYDEYHRQVGHETELREVVRRFRDADQALQRLDRARKAFRQAVLKAHDAGANKSELGRTLNVSRQRVDEILTRARHEAAAGAEDLTD